MKREHRVDPKKPYAADTDDHQDRRQGRRAHTSQGVDEDIQDAVEDQEGSDIFDTDHADIDDSRFVRIKCQYQRTGEIDGDAHDHGADDDQDQCFYHDLLDAVESAGSHTLAGKGDRGLVEGHISDIDEVFDIGSGRVAGNDIGGIEGIDAGLNDDVGQCEDCAG